MHLILVEQDAESTSSCDGIHPSEGGSGRWRWYSFGPWSGSTCWNSWVSIAAKLLITHQNLPHFQGTEGVLLPPQELRRGADPACIYSLAFSKGDSPDWLAVSSDKGTIHIFSLHRKTPTSPDSAPNGAPERVAQARNPLSALSFVSVCCPLTLPSPILNCISEYTPLSITPWLPF